MKIKYSFRVSILSSYHKIFAIPKLRVVVLSCDPYTVQKPCDSLLNILC